jgi:hypothetical protein
MQRRRRLLPESGCMTSQAKCSSHESTDPKPKYYLQYTTITCPTSLERSAPLTYCPGSGLRCQTVPCLTPTTPSPPLAARGPTTSAILLHLVTTPRCWHANGQNTAEMDIRTATMPALEISEFQVRYTACWMESPGIRR